MDTTRGAHKKPNTYASRVTRAPAALWPCSRHLLGGMSLPSLLIQLEPLRALQLVLRDGVAVEGQQAECSTLLQQLRRYSPDPAGRPPVTPARCNDGYGPG